MPLDFRDFSSGISHKSIFITSLSLAGIQRIELIFIYFLGVSPCVDQPKALPNC